MLTQEEWEEEECKNECSLLMESLHYSKMLRELVELGVQETPQYEPYEKELQKAETFHMLDEEPEVNHRGPVCECKNIAPKRGQYGQRSNGMPET